MAQNDFSFLPFGAGGIPANENNGTSLAAPRWYQGTAVPTAGTYNTGDIVFNTSPVAGTVGVPTILGWICSTAGTPGTWLTLNAAVPVTTITTTATSGTLVGGAAITLLNPASTGTYTLPDALANQSGSVIRFKNIASGSTTLTPSGANNYDAAAITLAQFGVVNLISVGTTTWYKAA